MNQLLRAHAPIGAPQAFWQSQLAARLGEISAAGATGQLSYAVELVLCAQQQGEIVAWVQPQGGALYPPDLDESGVDLQALIVVHVPPQAGFFGGPKAAEILLRSNGFGLVVLDLTTTPPPAGALAWQQRLLALARQHQCSVVILTRKPCHAESLGACISWRLQPQCQPMADRMFLLVPQVLKNKAGQSWPTAALQRRGPWGVW